MIELIDKAAKDACWFSSVTRQNRKLPPCKWIVETGSGYLQSLVAPPVHIKVIALT